MRIMDCRDIEFSPGKSRERIQRALEVFDPGTLNRLLGFSLHLLGAKRKRIASLVNASEESVKTSSRVLFRDGFPALRDRRYSEVQHVASRVARPLEVSTRREGQWQIVDFGVAGKELRIPVANKIQLRTVLLSSYNSGVLSIEDTALGLGISEAHCRELGKKLRSMDVAESLIDKRRGQIQDYRVGPAEKAELIQQFAARSVLRLSISSEALAALVNEQTVGTISPRSVRWHMEKLGLTKIRKTLPDLVDTQKKILNKDL